MCCVDQLRPPDKADKVYINRSERGRHDMAVYAQKIPRNAVRLLDTVPDSHQISHTMIVDFA